MKESFLAESLFQIRFEVARLATCLEFGVKGQLDQLMVWVYFFNHREHRLHRVSAAYNLALGFRIFWLDPRFVDDARRNSFS